MKCNLTMSITWFLKVKCVNVIDDHDVDSCMFTLVISLLCIFQCHNYVHMKLIKIHSLYLRDISIVDGCPSC